VLKSLATDPPDLKTGYYGFRCDIFCWLTENKDQSGRNRKMKEAVPGLYDSTQFGLPFLRTTGS
jgi:hypothetical protein